MATHEIAQDQWESFFAVFSERRSGAVVTVEIADPQKGPRKAETNQAMTSIRLDDAGNVVVQFGGDGASRTITEPKAVYHKSAAGLMSDEVNQDEIIEITSAGDPPITQLHFSG